MSDDIDIEEHDVMASVAEKDVFVDLSIVKQEVLDIEYEDLSSGAICRHPPSPQLTATCSVEVHNADSTTDDLPEPPATLESPLTVSSSDYIQTTTTNKDIDSYWDDYEKLKEEAKSNITKVMLEDWSFYISQCKSYCEHCEILFPTENALAAHNMLSHSYLVAVEGNTTIPSPAQTPTLISDHSYTGGMMRSIQIIKIGGDLFRCLLCNKKFTQRSNARRHYLNIHRIPSTHVESDSETDVSVSSKSTNYSHKMSYGNTKEIVENQCGSICKVASNQSPSTNNTCQLCGEFFINKDLLLNHLYEKHFPTKSYNCEKCNSTFSTKILLLQHKCKDNKRIEENKLFANTNRQSEPQDNFVSEAYRCNICFSYYLTIMNVLQHMSEYHKQNLETVPEELIVDTINLICPFCSGYFKFLQSYNRHIKVKHPEKLVALSTDKSFKPELVLKKIEKDVISYRGNPDLASEKIIKLHNGFRCGLCFKVFLKYSSAYSHRVRSHANVKKHIIFKNSKFQKSNKIPWTVIKHKKNGILLPKNVVYKCPKCKIHSTSVSDSENHIEKHSLDIDCMNTKKCEKCNLHFTLSSIENHLKQHNFSQNFTKIIVENTNLFKERILHRCPKCLIHFSEPSLVKHYVTCGGVSVKSNTCSKCNIVIENHSYFYHQRYHLRNLTDMVIVNYVCVDETAEAARKWKFFYCDKCTCYITNTESRFVTHKPGKCLKFVKDVCVFCGLMMPLPSLSYHMKFHKTVDGMNFTNYDFYNNIGPPGKINPPPPLFPKCDKCDVYYESLDAKLTHICADVIAVTCQQCGIRLTNRAHFFHMCYHNYNTKKMSIENVADQSNKMEQYVLNILFLCKNCNIVVDSYDDLVRHCQMRQLNKASSTMLCDVCDLNFDELCYNNHMRRHVKADISRSDFKIISFSETEFFKPNWLSFFYIKDGTANMGVLQEMVKASIYKCVKYVKLHLHKNGGPNCVVYECALCHTIVNEDFIFPHILKYTDGSCRQQVTLECKLCNFKFIGALSLKRHKTEFDHNEKNYQVVRFNYPEDRHYNMELIKLYKMNNKNEIEMSDDFPNLDQMNISTSQEENSIVYSGVNEKSDHTGEKESDAIKFTKKRIYKMYQCRICNMVINTKNNCFRHSMMTCGKKTNRVACKKCNLTFCSTVWRKHTELHRKFKDLRRDNIILFTFFKEGTKIKFSSRVSGIETITETRNEVKSIYTRREDQPVKKYPFYQCRNCGTCVTSSNGARKHTTFIYNCKEMRKKLQKCPICGLKFYQNLSSHMQMHDHHCDMNRKTVKLIPFGDRNDTEDSDSHSDEPSQDNTIDIQSDGAVSKKKYFLYRCTECDVCMSTKEGMRLHKSQNFHSPTSNNHTECAICLCKFSNHTWHNHMMKHQTYNDYVIDNIEIVSFNPNSTVVEEANTSIKHMENEEEVEMIFENETDMNSQASISATSQTSTNMYKIYRCIKCGLYTNSKYGYHHHITDTNTLDYKTCQLCNFTFTPKSLQYHMKHHEKPDYTIDNIQVIEFGKSLSGEGTTTKNSDIVDDTDESITSSMRTNESEKTDYVLFKCNQCDVCVKTMQGAYKHTFYSSHKEVDAKECPHCNYKFHVSNMTGHEKMHTKYEDYSAENIKIIAFSQKPISGGKIVSNVYYKEIYSGKKGLTSDTLTKKYILYQCSICKIHTTTKKHVYGHRNDLLRKYSIPSYHCKLCKLNFFHKSYIVHNGLHRKYKDYTIKNIEIVIISPKLKQKVPRAIENESGEISKIDKKYILYKCMECNLYMYSRKCVNFHFKMDHRVARGYKTCTLCNYRFSKKGWSIHSKVHKKLKDYVKENMKIVRLYQEPKAGEPISGKVRCKGIGTEESHDEAPWNSASSKYTLYKCVQCKLCMHNKKSAIKHNMSSLHVADVSAGYCKYCNCKFRSKSLNLHLKMHREHKDFVKENIKLIVFGEKSVGNVTTRNVKNDLSQDLKRFVLYKCNECSQCLNTKQSANAHEKNNAHSVVSYPCKICNLQFSRKGMFYHKLLHKQHKDLSIDNVTIVRFGKNISKREARSDDVKTKEHLGTNMVESIPESSRDRQSDCKKIILYKCRTCSLCVQSRKGIDNHKRINVTHTSRRGETKCKYCGYKFSKKGIHSHLLLHRQHKNYTADLIEIIEFGDKPEFVKSENRKRKHDGRTDGDSPEIVEKEARLFKCSCGLHFLNENSIEKHLCICGKDDTITKQSCSKCGLKFTTESLFSHLCTHHGNVKYKYKYEIVEMPPSVAKELIVLYKCIKCDTHFLGCNGAKKHASSCRGAESRKISRECDKCGLYFHFKLLMEHRMYHHILTKSIVNYEYKIVNVSDSTDESDTENHRLYKCLSCAIHFVKKSSIEEHLKIPHKTKMDINTLDCEVCNLTFTLRTLAGHKKIHHEKCNIDEFEIHEYDSFSKMEVAMKRHSINAVPENTTTSTLNKSEEEDIDASKVDDSLEEIFAEVSSATKEKRKEVSKILYKCSECNVHYLKESTVYKHTIKNHQRIHPTDIFECKHCGLNFRALTLTPHTRQHHYDNNFEVKDFIIHEYEPLTRETVLKNKKSTPRITIYNAADDAKNVDTREKLDRSHEEEREGVPPETIKNFDDCNKTIEQVNSNEQESMHSTEVNKVLSTTTNETKDLGFSDCTDRKHEAKDNDLGKSVMEVETHASEKSIRNFIIFES